MPLGAVQVMGDGLPVVLMSDRGTTGGYTKIATVIGVDIPRLAQAIPGDQIRFKAVTFEDALGLLEKQENSIRTCTHEIQNSVVSVPDRKARLAIDGQYYEISDEDGNLLTQTARGGSYASVSVRTVKTVIKGTSYSFEVVVESSNDE